MAECMQYELEMFVISSLDSSHKYTPQGVKLLRLSSATMGRRPQRLVTGISRIFYANVR